MLPRVVGTPSAVSLVQVLNGLFGKITPTFTSLFSLLQFFVSFYYFLLFLSWICTHSLGSNNAGKSVCLCVLYLRLLVVMSTG